MCLDGSTCILVCVFKRVYMCIGACVYETADLITLGLVDVSVVIIVDEAMELLDGLVAKPVFVALCVLLYAG